MDTCTKLHQSVDVTYSLKQPVVAQLLSNLPIYAFDILARWVFSPLIGACPEVIDSWAIVTNCKYDWSTNLWLHIQISRTTIVTAVQIQVIRNI